MDTLILNGLSSRAFTINNFSRNTSFDLESHIMNSIAYFDLLNTTNATSYLQQIGQGTVTNITIKHDDEVIYNLPNLNAAIRSISEVLVNGEIQINISIVFQ